VIENPMKHYTDYAMAHRKFQALPEEVKRKYGKLTKAGIGLVEFIRLHESGELDKLTVVIIEKEVKKEQEE